MKLIPIPKHHYDEYRLEVIFKGYKWDPQFQDNNTIAKHVLILSEAEHQELAQFTEQLARETVESEQFINKNMKLAKHLALPRKIRRDLKRMTAYNPDDHIRLMRFDFHPTGENGWAISEVNSDVPGGFAESSIMPAIAASAIPDNHVTYHNFGESLIQAVIEKVPTGAHIMLVHCTSYSDDRQVMQYLGDQLETLGYHALYGAADHIRFESKKAVSILDHYTGNIDAIIRFTPLEWLIDIKPKHWSGYFDTITPSCNHPVSLFAQSKRFPLIWDKLENQGVKLPTWRQLLPETCTINDAKHRDGFIYKPVWGRVGENITIKEACSVEEYEKTIKDIKRHPKRYIAQKKFNSKPLITDDNETFHVCIGAYSINGKASGYYARISKTPRIDSSAADIPVLIERSHHER